MPELKVSKPDPVQNTYDFSFFVPKRGCSSTVYRTAIIIRKTGIRISLGAYRKIEEPKKFKAGIDIKNRVICVTPARDNDQDAIEPTQKNLDKGIILISKSKNVINALLEMNCPPVIEGKLVDGELLFKF